ncbi:universal stress protein [Methanothrix sp.]|jgi:nucleotide-binding universal stress UspA family protein|uniref:universal stress protein n=1 Tax=Methanothrix sp. TaxID=90426 RepID=UPI00247D82C6|nr:universal stress protein [Methanothrix sp.]MCX8206924.1 universal stress protein [Methanothrix sp.]MDH7597142.1 universal stress protein [Methanothrix sp.]MDI9617196.1 universal stress protein [Methanothrix sp.]HOK58838.1 universal stress protein [Methanothrix sp.]HOL42780.1 universal stress protein [Methanothrix sp.]
MYKRILIATDGSDKSRLAAQEGLELAKALGAEVLALYVVNEVVIASAVRQLGADKKEVEAKLQKQGEKALDDIKEMGEKIGVKVEPVIRIGAPANVIIDVARTENIDCIVMGSHGESGVSKLLIGSVVQKVLYWATTPVLVVR